MNAAVKWVGLEPAKYNENILQLNIGFEVEGQEKLQYLRLPITGGSEAQTRFANAALASLLKQNTYNITIEKNSNGYDEVNVPRGGGDDAGF